MMRVLVIDTETTGLPENRTVRLSRQPEVIEFACVGLDLDSGEELSSWETLIRSANPIPDKIKQITGITDGELDGQPVFREVAQEIRRLIEGHDAVAAHNASFDAEMIDLEFERLEEKVSWPRKICTVEQSLHIKGHRMNLAMLHRHLLGKDHTDAHRAMADVRAVVRVLLEMRRRELI